MEIICSICCCSFIESKQETPFPFSRSPLGGSGSGSNSIYSSYCGHVFHKSCILRWIQKAHSCPDCRTELRGKSDFHKVFFNVNPKCDELEQAQPCDGEEEKLLMQKRTEKLTKYIKCVTKELGHVELKFDKLKDEIIKKDQEIAELKNLLNIERLMIPLRRQTLK
jgi:Ring finger domain